MLRGSERDCDWRKRATSFLGVKCLWNACGELVAKGSCVGFWRRRVVCLVWGLFRGRHGLGKEGRLKHVRGGEVVCILLFGAGIGWVVLGGVDGEGRSVMGFKSVLSGELSLGIQVGIQVDRHYTKYMKS